MQLRDCFCLFALSLTTPSALLLISSVHAPAALPTLLILDAATGAIVDAEGRTKVAAEKKLGGVFGPK